MNRTELKLKIYPESILRKKTQAVKDFNQELRDIFNRMVEIMRRHRGRGLAGNQVGLNLSILIADTGDKLYKLANPQIVHKEGKEVFEEGCLSLPNICIKIKRAKKIKVKAQDEYGNFLNLELEGLPARIVQHEIDHLKGKLIIDYVGFLKKMMLINKLKRMNYEGMCK
jgi:peptide deformylase